MISPMRNAERVMPRRAARAICVGVLAAATACHHNVEVRTVTAPGAQLAGRRTFHILPVPEYRGDTPLASSDPMLVNSITYQALRREIRSAFEERKYRFTLGSADFDVAYYASAANKLDIRSWDYRYNSRGIPRIETEVIPYEEGSVIVDVVDPATHRLLWRGQGRAVTSQDPQRYIEDLKKAVHEIVEKFPPPS
jgi:hypothetical protein